MGYAHAKQKPDTVKIEFSRGDEPKIEEHHFQLTYVNHVSVDDKRRGLGAGTVLMAELKARLEKESGTTGTKGIYLIDDGDDPAVTEKLYHRSKQCEGTIYSFEVFKPEKHSRGDCSAVPAV
jgi:Acetyltransferase (GNAT) family